MKQLGLAAALITVLLASASPAFGQATRTWVSGVGDDANPCSRTAPCRTWAGAISKTFTGGEINAIDPGAYGTVTITKSITIDGGGMFASALASSVNGVIINVPAGNVNDPNQRVTLRNIAINGTGPIGAVGTNTGLIGVRIDSAKAVQIQDVRIANFAQHGIDLTPTATNDTSLLLDGVTVAESFGNGLNLGSANATQKLNVMVNDSVIQGSRGTFGTAGERGIGVSADTGVHVWLLGTTIFDNLIGVRTFNRASGAAGIVDDLCGNGIAGNGEPGTLPNDLCTPAPAPIIVNPPAAPPPIIQTQMNTVRIEQCTVPDLRGLTTSFAGRLLKAANCALGKVTKKATKKKRQVGTITAQKTKAGTKLGKGSKIAVTVGSAGGKSARRAR
jgi:hypothetical protein